ALANRAASARTTSEIRRKVGTFGMYAKAEHSVDRAAAEPAGRSVRVAFQPFSPFGNLKDHAYRPPLERTRRSGAWHSRNARAHRAERRAASRMGPLAEVARDVARRIRRQPGIAVPCPPGHAAARMDSRRVARQREQSPRAVLPDHRAWPPAAWHRDRGVESHIGGRQPRASHGLPGSLTWLGIMRLPPRSARCSVVA